MINVTKTLKSDIQKLDSVEERLQHLKNGYSVDTAYLVTCGPSLTSHNKNMLTHKLKDKLVICAKQSYNYIGEICDIHLMSAYNYQSYVYNNSDTIVSWQLTGCNMESELNKITTVWNHPIDLYFPVISTPWIQKHQSIAYAKNFDEWKKLGTEVQVNWGPGILYESGFPLCFHLGVKKIVTIGWDIGDISKFNGQNHDYNWFDQHATELYSMRMDSGPDYDELVKTIECTTEMYDWFSKEGISVSILSDTNPADERFKRITIDEL